MSIELLLKINTSANIHTFANEKNISDALDKYNCADHLNWMKLFNSNIALSKEFVIKYIDNVIWSELIRPMDEFIVKRYAYKIINWNSQLYTTEPRTLDFIIDFQSKFDWNLIRRDPPVWFDDIHFELFEFQIYGNCSFLPKKPKCNQFEDSTSNQIDLIEINPEICETPQSWHAIIYDN